MTAFWVLAGVVTLYYGVRSVLMHDRGDSSMGRNGFVFVEIVQDMLFNMVCSAAGFVALAVLMDALSGTPDVLKMTSGGALFASFLGMVTVTGISGKLPELLHLGRFPAAK